MGNPARWKWKRFFSSPQLEATWNIFGILVCLLVIITQVSQYYSIFLTNLHHFLPERKKSSKKCWGQVRKLRVRPIIPHTLHSHSLQSIFPIYQLFITVSLAILVYLHHPTRFPALRKKTFFLEMPRKKMPTRVKCKQLTRIQDEHRGKRRVHIFSRRRGGKWKASNFLG